MNERTGNKITYLSYLMAMLVVMIHTNNTSVYGANAFLPWVQNFISSFAACAVPTFFAISGYLFFRNYEPKKLLQKWKSRVFSILIPYLLWNALAYLYLLTASAIPAVAAHMNESISFSVPGFLDTLIFGYGVNWYLKCLILFIAVAPIFYYLLKNRYIGLVVLIALGYVGFRFNAYGWYALQYFVGSYFGIHFKEIVEKRYGIVARLAALVAMVAIAILSPLTENEFIFRFLLIFCAWIAGDFLAIEKKPVWWMRISFFIYLSHCFLLEPIEKLFLLALGTTVAGSAVDYFIAPVATVLLVTAIAFLLRKCKPIWSLLSGNRGSA